MAVSKHTKLGIAVTLAVILAGIALIRSDPSNRELIALAAVAFLCLLFVKPERLLLVYLAISPLVDQLIPLFKGGGWLSPQILLRGGLLMVVVFYWVSNMRNPLTFRFARPVLMLLLLVTMSAVAFAGSRDSAQEIPAIAKLAFWTLLLLTVADMVMRGKMELKWIYRCFVLALVISIVSLALAGRAGINRVSGKYGVGEFSGTFAPHTLNIALSVGISAVIAIAARQRKASRFLPLLGLSVLVMISIMGTFVRAGYVTAVAGIFALYILLWRYRRYKGATRQRAILRGVCIVIIGSSVIYSFMHASALTTRFADFSGSGRTRVWLAAVKHYDSYSILAKLLGGGFTSASRFWEDRFMGTHNGFLLFLLYGGIAGLGLYIWLFASLWKEVRPFVESDHLPSVIAGAVIAAFITAEMVNGATFHLSATTYFAFLVGGAAGHYKAERIQLSHEPEKYPAPHTYLANWSRRKEEMAR